MSLALIASMKSELQSKSPFIISRLLSTSILGKKTLKLPTFSFIMILHRMSISKMSHDLLFSYG